MRADACRLERSIAGFACLRTAGGRVAPVQRPAIERGHGAARERGEPLARVRLRAAVGVKFPEVSDVALLDGSAVDDGTACEIGMFHALMRSDPTKKGIVGLLTDMRGRRGESTGLNLFVQGVIEDAGEIVDSLEAAAAVLGRWR